MIREREGWRAVEIVRVRNGAQAAGSDKAAAEGPLDIRLHGRPFVVTMRTPGADPTLAAGFLLSEGVVRHVDDIGELTQAAVDIIDVTLVGDAAARVERRLAERRHVTATSACGVCGRPASEALRTEAPEIVASWRVPASLVQVLPTRLRERQAVFDQTGGLHAAGVFALDGTLVAAAEDVGRHNAVDKAIGRLLLDRRLPLSSHILCVSGRASFELVQKAVIAGVPMLVAVSAPSTLAIDLARACNVTLAGFVRGDGFNVYAHPDRIA